MPEQSPAGRVPGARLVRVGAVLFVVGVVAAAAYVLPYFLGHHRPLSPALMFLADLAPLGFAVALAGVYPQVRAQRRVTGTPQR